MSPPAFDAGAHVDFGHSHECGFWAGCQGMGWTGAPHSIRRADRVQTMPRMLCAVSRWADSLTTRQTLPRYRHEPTTTPHRPISSILPTSAAKVDDLTLEQEHDRVEQVEAVGGGRVDGRDDGQPAVGQPLDHRHH